LGEGRKQEKHDGAKSVGLVCNPANLEVKKKERRDGGHQEKGEESGGERIQPEADSVLRGRIYESSRKKKQILPRRKEAETSGDLVRHPFAAGPGGPCWDIKLSGPPDQTGCLQKKS